MTTKSNATSTPVPDMSALHAPIARGWTRSQWKTWSDGDEDFFEKHQYQGGVDFDPWERVGGFDRYFNQRNEAMRWAAPEEIGVSISVLRADQQKNEEQQASTSTSTLTSDQKQNQNQNDYVVTLPKGGDRTFRSILDEYCAKAGVDRDSYHWVIREGTSASTTAATAPIALPFLDLSRRSVLCRTDEECFYRLWSCHPPTLVARWGAGTEQTAAHMYRPELLGQPKQPPSPPPPGDACDSEWSSWKRRNNCGDLECWAIRKHAVESCCPPRVAVTLEGVLHHHTVEMMADRPLSDALLSYCNSVSDGMDPILPTEVFLRHTNDEETYIDAQEMSARLLGVHFGDTDEDDCPIKLVVVYRDESRTQDELKIKRGPTPKGCVALSGSAYLLTEYERPWYITRTHGVATYNTLAEEAFVHYRGYDYDAAAGYDPIKGWFDMMSSTKKILSRLTRKPRGGWTAEGLPKTLDGLTALFLALTRESDWSRDALGKILFWNEDCRKESISLLRKMDTCAASVIIVAVEMCAGTTCTRTSASTGDRTATAEDDDLDLQAALDQLKRWMGKFQCEHEGFSERGSNHHGYLAFSKALKLL